MVDTFGVFLKKQWFIKSKPEKIENSYLFDPKKLIGSGTYGSVIKATLKGTTQKRAIKLIPKNKVKNPERFKNEIDIMRKLDHPNIIKLYETYEDIKNVYIVMELCEGGELFEKIIEKEKFSEFEARETFIQIMQALNYCHSNKICHRDLKPENFLLLTKSENSPIKVIDFGLSTIFIPEKQGGDGKKIAMKTKAGTVEFFNIEHSTFFKSLIIFRLKSSKDPTMKVATYGVILYVMLSGVPPFFGDSDAEILECVKKGEYTFDRKILPKLLGNLGKLMFIVPEFEGVSASAKDLIRKMLVKPSHRLSASQVLNHLWMQHSQSLSKSSLKINWSSLKNFHNYCRLKKATLTYIASQLSENEITELGRFFKSIDKNNDGVLTIDEIKNGLLENKESFSGKDILSIVRGVDTDGSGTINYSEFIAATIEDNIELKEEKLLQAFKMFDLDGSGKISAEELKQILGNNETVKNTDQKYWEEMIKEVDKNGDGEVDYNEFLEMMKKQQI